MTYDFEKKLGTWYPAFRRLVLSPELSDIGSLIAIDHLSGKEIQPPLESIFRAFQMCSIDKLKVVIIGQD